MNVSKDKKDDMITFRITGDIDHHSAGTIRERIDRETMEEKPKRLALDLSGTDFMDSSGLGLILGRMRKCQEMDIGFVLLNPTPPILKILRLAGVEKMMEIQYL